MADNYLERRMDDLRSGRLSADIRKTVTHSTARNNKVINFNFTSKRILIIGGTAGIGGKLATAFIEAGCRVTVFDHDEQYGRLIARDGRIRFTHIEKDNVATAEQAWQSLISAWHDTDVVIVISRLIDTDLLAQWWATRRTTHPSVSLVNSTLILLYPNRKESEGTDQNNSSSHAVPATAREEELSDLYNEGDVEITLHRLYTLLHRHNITVSALGYSGTAASIIQNCMFLAVPNSECRRIIMY